MMMTYSNPRCPIVVRTTETRVLLTMACDTEGTCISRGFRCRHRICQICWPLALGCRLVVVIGSQFGTGPPARSGAAPQALSQSWAAVSCRERLTCWAGWQKPNNRSFLVADRFGTRKNAAGRDPRKGAVVGLGLCDDFSAGYQKFMVGVHMGWKWAPPLMPTPTTTNALQVGTLGQSRHTVPTMSRQYGMYQNITAAQPPALVRPCMTSSCGKRGDS